jgi:hypothetical protein
MTLTGRLEHAKARPFFVEDAVRTALRDAIAWRIGGGGAPRAEAFVAAAIAAARLGLDALDCDSVECSRTLAAVQRAARRFAISALGRRLMTVPAAQFLRLPRVAHGPDAIVRDRRRRLHAISLTARCGAFDAGQIASRSARATPLSVVDRLTPLTVHVFSLATAQRHTFVREVSSEHANRSDARVA